MIVGTILSIQWGRILDYKELESDKQVDFVGSKIGHLIWSPDVTDWDNDGSRNWNKGNQWKF